MSLDTLGGVPPSPGRMNVDFEERVDFMRLRAYRLSRAREALEASELGAVLLFDINNIRYVTATMIGEWARDKVARYALLTRGGEPIVWDFGSAARHHQLYAPWIRPEAPAWEVLPVSSSMWARSMPTRNPSGRSR